MSAKFINERTYLSLTVEQLRGRLEEKGLSMTGKNKVLLERLVNAQYVLQSNVDVKPELQESSNFTEVSKESPRPDNKEQAQEIGFIRRKAKTLQMDMDDLIRDIVEQVKTPITRLKYSSK